MKVKNQHYVPRFYLNQFVFEKNKIWVYDKLIRKQFIASLLDVASEKYFYDDEALDKKYGKSQFLENFYADIEFKSAQDINDFLKNIRNSVDYEITSKERESIANYLVTQIDRTIEHREETFQFTQEMYDQLKEKGFNEDQLIHLGFETDQFDKKQLHLESIINGNEMRETLSQILFEHIWIIFKNETNIGFYTSDSPIVKHGHLSDEIRTEEGYASPGIEIAFPLNPEYILILLDREYFYEMENCDGKILKLNRLENIEYYNSMQVAMSYRQVFSMHNDFKLVEEMFKANPENFDIFRKRIG